MLCDPLIEQARLCLRQCFVRLNEHTGVDLRLPHLSFNQRGRSAGSARLQANEIRLNASLYQENIDQFINEVIPHEAAHIAVYQIYGKVRPHGPQWRAMMQQVFNLPPRATHRMDTSSVSGKTFSYLCRCGVVELSIRRHNKVIRGKQLYSCRQCNDVLKPAGLGR